MLAYDRAGMFVLDFWEQSLAEVFEISKSLVSGL